MNARVGCYLSDNVKVLVVSAFPVWCRCSEMLNIRQSCWMGYNSCKFASIHGVFFSYTSFHFTLFKLVSSELFTCTIIQCDWFVQHDACQTRKRNKSRFMFSSAFGFESLDYVIR